ncbi:MULTISPECIES: phage gene 29 protein family protein [Mycolicibacterium]|uniref:Minor tail protein n=1 Tax=Mycobacterium phage Bipper TaxID=1805457 RepID=A0A142F2F4_9CAUD|nr:MULTISPECIES: hypothetical protein [Mycolicibacterium]YP_009303173.1 minor tail protein [Mycobacterium phage Bipper]QDF19312.1 minor tail protein [Mycobacterium phage Cracklewink]AMQ66961.1 minor tail protein [Mycobacterium phage Bipper]MCC9181073.1 hypothetical protein [Mycolicibacterium mageritense]UBV14792.1 hypothetical protein H8Z57_29530 [Mycolicibacterium fortuitum]
MGTTELSERDLAVCLEADECEDWDDPDLAVGLAAGLDLQKARKVAQMRDVQRAYMELLEVMEYPVDQRGVPHDLNAMSASVLAIAWTAALYGFRRSGDALIKKRKMFGPGLYENACTWVDVNAPDDAERDLKPGDFSDDRLRPPDVRGLAARRDGEGPQVIAEWHTKAEVRYTDEPRPKG